MRQAVVRGTHVPEPEWLGRDDTENGEWTIEDCEPRRGIPATGIVDRIMRAPTQNTELSRVIRAHEMMHAKVSPAGEWEQWQRRGIASKEALIVCEELRVNYLCQRAGFDVETHLMDGGETADGERVACTNDWKGAVHMAIATAGTASNKPFLNGVRRHNRLWGKALLDISKRAYKEMGNYYKGGMLASTVVHERTGLAPFGFFYTENLAEWVDRLAGMDPPTEEEEKAEEPKDASETEEGTGKTDKREHSNKGITETPTKPDLMGAIKGITPDRMNGQVPYWGELKIRHLPLTVLTQGNLGKKKSASNIGRSPRRLHRYMSDPQRRIFDNKKRGMGGVVVVDASGSMSLSQDDVRRIVEASPGCTVIAYSDMDNCRGMDNAWILADKGRMVGEGDFPRMGKGNGVDFPALEWAVKHRQHSSAPVIWVTDGGVCGPNQGFSELLANQCTAYCIEKKIIVTANAEHAIETLEKLRTGAPVERGYPAMLREAWHNRNGVVLQETTLRR